MAIKQMSYLDIAPEARKKAGVRRLNQLRHTLSDRSLPPDHRARVESEVKLVNAWMAGTVTPAPAAEPAHHVVAVAESVTVKDD